MENTSGIRVVGLGLLIAKIHLVPEHSLADSRIDLLLLSTICDLGDSSVFWVGCGGNQDDIVHTNDRRTSVGLFILHFGRQ